MRVRLATNSPLPTLKAWFSLQSLPATATILDFKRQLCSDVQVLRGLRKQDITLLLDDFQLLDEGPIHVIRDGDLIWKAASLDQSSGNTGITSTSKKRKRVDSVTNQTLPTHSSCKNVGTVSSSDSSSESTSSSSSSSSSECTSSDSESDADSPPSAPSRLTRDAAKTRPSTIFIPPGQGKPTTHSRNLRRRRKKQYGRMAVDQIPDNQAVGVNAIPLGDVHTDAETKSVLEISPTEQVNKRSDLAMSSLSNKNKRRGFKNGMGQAVPSKILFSQEKEEETVLSQVLPRLIPPSEKQKAGQLPANMFVTSVNVEEGLHSKRRRKKALTPENHDNPSVQDIENSDQGLDLNAIEQNWDALVQIKEQLNLCAGTLVGWKALGINPATITPEVLLYTAHVVEMKESGVLVRPLTPVLFDQEEVADVSYLWSDIIGGQWRIISMGPTGM